MYFKRIELNGFKSFADPVVMEFTDGMTCIVGPNGSGKSNISDAIRWVLGEQSPKMLRGGKMEEVIFAGTQSRKPKGMAEVTLVIDNSEKILAIDFAEVGITRRMYRSGESEYLINRTPCRLRDIRELIMDTGIGVEGYSIIGQGKIADIVSNKMESRREIFEEAAGIVKYRTKKAETERKLENSAGYLDRVNDIVREIEERIGGLEEDSKKASEFLVLREQYKSAEINIILKNVSAAESKAQAVKQELKELEGAIAVSMGEKENLSAVLNGLRNKSLSLEDRLGDIRDRLLQKAGEINFITNKEELNKERLSALDKDEKRLTDELLVLEAKHASELENLKSMAETGKTAMEEQQALDSVAHSKHEAYEAVNSKALELQASLDAARNSLFEASGRMSAARAEAESISSLKETLIKRSERLKADESLFGKSGADIEEKLEKARLAERQLSERRAASEKKLNALAEEHSGIESALRQATSTAEELRLSEGRLSSRHKLLEELESSYEGYGGSVRFLMKKSPEGIWGVFGELISVPRGLEVAVETALGPALQNIVCKDDACAKAAIKILKDNQAGRLTFLPQESIRPGRAYGVEKLEGRPGYIGRASDMVTCRGGAENIVEYLLGRVILCEDLDNAMALSKSSDGPFRFVTRNGEVINPAGAITGGSLKNNTGSILSRKSEMEALDAKLNEISNRLSDCLRQKAEREGELSVVTSASQQEAAILRDLDTEAAVLSKDIQQLSLSLKEASEGDTRAMAELSDLANEIENAEAGIKDILAGVDTYEEQRAAAEAEAASIAALLEQEKDRLVVAKQEETDALLARSNASVRAQGVKELENRVRLAVEELQAELSQRKRSLADIEAQRSEIAASGEGASDALAQKEFEKKELEDELSAVTAERQGVNSEAEALEAGRAEADKALYDKQLQKHDADIRLARYEAQTETLKEKLWDEFEISFAQAAELKDDDFVMSKGLKESKELKERLRALGDVNIGAIEEYKAVSQRYGFLTAQRDDLLKAIDELKTVIADMDVTIKEKFKESFDSVVDNFETTFTELFGGGHARLSMEDPDNPLDSTIEIEAQPPGKKLQNINLLSGGEKTMTAIALMFAVLKAKPTPFCILDEVEAALDEANIDCFARYLKNFGPTQFALVTHQKATMEYADVLYGVTMPEQGVSKVLSLKLGDSFDM